MVLDWGWSSPFSELMEVNGCPLLARRWGWSAVTDGAGVGALLGWGAMCGWWRA